jgi:3-oxoacyl-[acyl-carrier protein] reductase
VRVVEVVADLSKPDDVARVIDAALGTFGGVDVLVTNTGGPPAGPFESHSLAAWHDATRGLLDSVVNLVRGALPGMKEQRWGRIINVTSIAVKQPVDGLILSNSLRAAVTGFARTLANEVASFGITVNNVMPGYTATQRITDLANTNAALKGTTPDAERAAWETQIPMRRLGDVREFAAMVAFLASERASYTTGASIPVDGGWIRSLV